MSLQEHDEVEVGGMTFEQVKRVVSLVRCDPYQFVLGRDDANGGWYLQTLLWRKDRQSQQGGWGHGARQWIDCDMTEQAIVKRCLVAAKAFAEHEVLEAFTYQGDRVFDPHKDIL